MQTIEPKRTALDWKHVLDRDLRKQSLTLLLWYLPDVSMIAETFRQDGTLWTSRRITAGLDNSLATYVSELTGLPTGGYIALPKKEITPLDVLLYSPSLPDVYLRFQPTITFAAPRTGSTMLTPKQHALFTIGRLNENGEQVIDATSAASFAEGWDYLQQEQVTENIRQKILCAKR